MPERAQLPSGHERLFISSASKDDEAVAALTKLRVRSTWDYRKDQVPSDEWWLAIQRAIVECDAVAVVLSAHWLESGLCVAELAHAVAHRKRLVPVRLSAEIGIPEALKPLLHARGSCVGFAGASRFGTRR